MKMVKCLPEFENFYCILEKNRNFISKIRRSKVTDYAALTGPMMRDVIKGLYYIKNDIKIFSDLLKWLHLHG